MNITQRCDGGVLLSSATQAIVLNAEDLTMLKWSQLQNVIDKHGSYEMDLTTEANQKKTVATYPYNDTQMVSFKHGGNKIYLNRFHWAAWPVDGTATSHLERLVYGQLNDPLTTAFDALIVKHCTGCQENAPSEPDHTCMNMPMEEKVSRFLSQALNEMEVGAAFDRIVKMHRARHHTYKMELYQYWSVMENIIRKNARGILNK